MATLAQLAATGQIFRHDADLEAQEMPERYIYFSPSFADWVNDVLPHLPRDRARALLPLEQVEQAFYNFVIRRPMAYGQHDRKLDPLHFHVWELKTEDVRVIGWFPARATFLAVCGEMKINLKTFAKYAPFIQRVVAFRTNLPLDPPKMLPGAIHADVL